MATRKATAPQARSIRDITLSERMEFIAAWHPPIPGIARNQGSRRTWQQFFAEWRVLRDGFIERYPRVGEFFADRLRREVSENPGKVYETHRHAALQHSHFYEFGDEHVHIDPSTKGLGRAMEVRKESVWPQA